MSEELQKQIEIRHKDCGRYYINHNDNIYTLKVDNHGKLVISALGNQLIIKPIASNCVEISQSE